MTTVAPQCRPLLCLDDVGSWSCAVASDDSGCSPGMLIVQLHQDRITWSQQRQGLCSMSKVEVERVFLLLLGVLAPDGF